MLYNVGNSDFSSIQWKSWKLLRNDGSSCRIPADWWMRCEHDPHRLCRCFRERVGMWSVSDDKVWCSRWRCHGGFMNRSYKSVHTGLFLKRLACCWLCYFSSREQHGTEPDSYLGRPLFDSQFRGRQFLIMLFTVFIIPSRNNSLKCSFTVRVLNETKSHDVCLSVPVPPLCKNFESNDGLGMNIMLLGTTIL
jgi:hypothetical protein